MLASLIQTESIIWRKPAPANALPLLELAERQIVELATAKNTDEPDDKLIARLERELSDTLDELPEAEEIRITVRGATVADQARWRTLTVVGNAYYRSVVGEDPGAETDEEMTDEETQERTNLLVGLYKWAINLACLAKIEERSIPYLVMPGVKETPDDAGWKTVDVPDWMRDPEQYLTNMPPTLHNEWHEVAHEVNPGVWAGGSFLAKKHGHRDQPPRRRLH